MSTPSGAAPASSSCTAVCVRLCVCCRGWCGDTNSNSVDVRIPCDECQKSDDKPGQLRTCCLADLPEELSCTQGQVNATILTPGLLHGSSTCLSLCISQAPNWQVLRPAAAGTRPAGRRSFSERRPIVKPQEPCKNQRCLLLERSLGEELLRVNRSQESRGQQICLSVAHKSYNYMLNELQPKLDAASSAVVKPSRLSKGTLPPAPPW